MKTGDRFKAAFDFQKSGSYKESVPQLMKAAGLEYVKGDEDRCLLVRASNGEVDSDGDIIHPGGWEFKNFQKNPVLLKNHNSWDPAIGVVLSNEVRDREDPGEHEHQKQELVSVIYFDKSEEGEQYLFKYAAKIMRAFSVRFLGKALRDVTPDERQQFKMGPYGYYIKKQSLVELSAVTLPSNTDAVVLEKNAITEALEKSNRYLEALHEQLKTFPALLGRFDELEKTVRSLQRGDLPQAKGASSLDPYEVKLDEALAALGAYSKESE